MDDDDDSFCKYGTPLKPYEEGKYALISLINVSHCQTFWIIFFR